MTPPQTLENRASEMRARLSELGGLEDFTDETRAELAALRRERQDNESKRNALRTAGDGPTPPVETRNDGVGGTPPRLKSTAPTEATWARWWTASSKTVPAATGPTRKCANTTAWPLGRFPVNGGGMLGHWGVGVQGECPFKRPA